MHLSLLRRRLLGLHPHLHHLRRHHRHRHLRRHHHHRHHFHPQHRHHRRLGHCPRHPPLHLYHHRQAQFLLRRLPPLLRPRHHLHQRQQVRH